MTDQELGQFLLSGRWTTLEIHEAGRRLVARSGTHDYPPNYSGWWPLPEEKGDGRA